MLSNQFIVEGVERGEKAIVAVFEKRPNDYLQTTPRGQVFETLIREKKLEVLYLRPLDLSIDETLVEIQNAVKRLGAKRAVIDSLSGLELALAPTFRDDFRESLYRMMGALTGLGVTVMATVELEDSYTDLRFSPQGIAFLTDAIIIQRYVEIDGQLRRALAVVKVRSSQHSKDAEGVRDLVGRRDRRGQSARRVSGPSDGDSAGAGDGQMMPTHEQDAHDDRERVMAKQRITVELDEETIRYLAMLGKPIEVLAQLAHSAADGLRRPDRRHRDQTDESLRVERDKTDAAVAKKREVVEGVADEVIRIARQRADQVVHAARDESDRERGPQPTATEGSSERERTRADGLLADERSNADAVLENERSEQRRYPHDFLAEREATDTNLTGERAHVDTLVVDQREANARMVSATIRAQELSEEADAAKERAEGSERELRAVAEFREMFIGILGHDLRNPLASIVMAAASAASARSPRRARRGDGRAHHPRQPAHAPDDHSAARSHARSSRRRVVRSIRSRPICASSAETSSRNSRRPSNWRSKAT